ncbi:MAG TPA: malto-oligosyltrehalose synthase [Bryobacteraceae bacterium]|nr:malto-oligosyltrehalose synthase [Bryobacteraceae bacterium]
MSQLRVPISTYRVQFTRDFRFVDCRELVAYLHGLGVGDLYSSPRFRPQRGSSHGYDVTHPGRVNSELGTDEEFDDLCEKLKHYGMGLLLDIVPNHMAASHENSWWMDVLENGPGSPYAQFFDIDWRPATSKAAFLLEDKILLPVLGDLYGNVLENGKLAVHLDESGFFLRYHERRLPLDPCSYAPILEQCVDQITGQIAAGHPSIDELRQLQSIVEGMPRRTATEPVEAGRRRELSQSLKQRLFHLYRDHLEVRLAIDAALRDLSDTKDRPERADFLDRILAGQGYRLAHWKIAYEEINYRRFFDINDLVRLRVEDEEVFRTRHEPILQLVKEGKVTGLRVDHIDGLHDPQGYLERLQAELGGKGSPPSFYVVVEKVLGRDEPLPRQWRACGTTGYDFLNVLNDVFVHPDGLRSLEETYANFTGDRMPFAEVCYARNKQVMWKLFAGEVHELGHHLGALAAQDRQARDVPLSELMNALVETTACLPVYRTYIRDFTVDERDRHYIERTLDLARRRTSEIRVSTAAFDFLRRVLLLEPPAYAKDQKPQWLRFVMRWQQFTGPVMAKGLEDTAFYAQHCLISRNEVGGDPLREGPPYSLTDFHSILKDQNEHWPYAMNTTSSHDTKRSEDVRARINVLSELPDEWRNRLSRWNRWNGDKKTTVNGHEVPSPTEEVLIYQTLLGAWPLEPDENRSFLERLKCFLVKAAREAKDHSGWLRPNQAHEEALVCFAESILDPTESNRFLPDFLRFQERLALHGAFNALSQVLIKITAPGVPDFYQGTELWDFSLVDPDNRRPVDYRTRIALLEQLRKRETENLRGLLREIVSGWKDGRIKLYLTDKALDFRRAHTDVFLAGDYLPVEATGAKKDNLVAFCRRHETTWALTVAPRWTTQLTATYRVPLGERAWSDTALRLPEGAPHSWRDVLSGEIVDVQLREGVRSVLRVRDLLRRFPVAVLTNTAESEHARKTPVR